MLRVIAHGGTGSTPRQRDGTRKAAQAGLKALRGDGPVAAVVEAVRVLEDDPRFNAGTGSAYRLDGKTIEMDAAVIREDGSYGAVACIQRVRNPVLIARQLLECPTNILAGEMALRFARGMGHKDHDPATARQRVAYRKLMRHVKDGSAGRAENQWRAKDLKKAWNYDTPFNEVFPRGFPPSKGAQAMRASDTIGAVATDGARFAAAASTGGTTTTLLGRIGDTATLGAGIIASHSGAVACTGLGDKILRDRLAGRIADWLDGGVTPEQALERAKARFPSWADLGAVILSQEAYAAGGNRSMAWSMEEEDE
jgi:L-asparaginase/beta-aspartyl-peptidase (threonine type)